MKTRAKFFKVAGVVLVLISMLFCMLISSNCSKKLRTNLLSELLC